MKKLEMAQMLADMMMERQVGFVSHTHEYYVKMWMRESKASLEVRLDKLTAPVK